MRRIPLVRCVVAAALAVPLGVGAPTFAGRPPGGPAPLAKGWGRVVASGTVTAVDRAHGRLRFAGTGTVDRFEGGALWRKAPLTGAHAVRMFAATELIDPSAHTLPAAELRPGAAVALWGVARPDADIDALTLEVVSPPPPPPVPAGVAAAQAAPQRGVVVAHSGATIMLLSAAGTERSVVVSATTAVSAGGRAAAGGSIAPDDVVKFDGPVNSDGSVIATAITVEFSAAASPRVSGTVEQRLAALGGLVVDGTMIATSSDTYALHGSVGAALSDAAPGRLVVAYGIPVMDDAVPVGLAARVIVLR